eukprot:SAG22_NODE_6698_length_822_cov_0.919779_1_plen_183_part_10
MGPPARLPAAAAAVLVLALQASLCAGQQGAAPAIAAEPRSAEAINPSFLAPRVLHAEGRCAGPEEGPGARAMLNSTLCAVARQAVAQVCCDDWAGERASPCSIASQALFGDFCTVSCAAALHKARTCFPEDVRNFSWVGRAERACPRVCGRPETSSAMAVRCEDQFGFVSEDALTAGRCPGQM